MLKQAVQPVSCHTLEFCRRYLSLGLTLGFGSLALVALSGCYVYVPVAVDTVPVGSHVRVALSPQAVLQSGRGAREGDETISGTLLRRDVQDLVLRVKSASAGPAFRSQALYREMVVAPQDVTSIEVKRLHAFRTGAALATLAGGITVLVLQSRGEPGTGGKTPTGGIDDRRGVWPFRWRSILPP